ncbi:MAG: metallophosphoesterase [Bacteroidaceae bacterium]|nr:metallophosphoesterase [Bacteroidaceae bacterium]
MRRIIFSLLILCALASCTSVRYAGVGRVRDYDISSPEVPAAFDGYRIAFASDFHLESRFKQRQLHGTVKALQALAPDVLMLGGDYQEGCEYVEPLLAEIARVMPPDGIYAVLGNNDYERCTDLIRSTMERYDIHLLEEAADTICKEGSCIVVWGTNPYAGRYPTAMIRAKTRNSELITQDSYVILLTHTPDHVDDVGIANADLALAGHTHGGQVTFFGLYAPITASKYGMRYRTGMKRSRTGIPIIISNGLGTSRYPIRLFAPTDIIIITLHSE